MRKLAEDNIVIFSSHILSDIWRLCEKIYVLKEGNLIAENKPETILSQMTDDSFFVTGESNIEEIKNFLNRVKFVNEVKIQGEKIIFRFEDISKLKQLLGELLEKFEIVAFGPNIPDLDQIFTRLVDAS